MSALNISEIFFADFAFIISNGVCRNMSAQFPDLFSWVGVMQFDESLRPL